MLANLLLPTAPCDRDRRDRPTGREKKVDTQPMHIRSDAQNDNIYKLLGYPDVRNDSIYKVFGHPHTRNDNI